MFEKSKFRQNEKLSVKLTCIVILSKLDFILNRKFFFQFGNMLLNNLPKNDVWELEKYLKRKKWMVQMVKNLPNLSWIRSTNGPVMKIFIIKVPMLEGKNCTRNFL